MTGVTGNGRVAKAQMWMEQNELNQAKQRNDVQAKQEGMAKQALRGGFKEMAQFNPQKPVLQTMDLDDMNESRRNNYMQSFNTWEEAEKRGDISQKDWANAKIQSMIANGENPGDYMNVLALYGDAETPEERAKRERREQLGQTFQYLGDLIGSAAGMYYASKSGYSNGISDAHVKHRERMDRLKAKQDELDEQRKRIILNAKLGDVKADRAERLAEKTAKANAAIKDKEFKQNIYLKGLDHANKMEQNKATAKAREAEAAKKHQNDMELAKTKHGYNVALKGMKDGNDDKVVTSLTGSDGGTWTRNTKLSNEEMMELAKYVEDWAPYTTVDEDNKKTIDFAGAIADASDSGMIPDYILEEKGFKRSKDSKRRKKDDDVAPPSRRKKENDNIPPTKRNK